MSLNISWFITDETLTMIEFCLGLSDESVAMFLFSSFHFVEESLVGRFD